MFYSDISADLLFLLFHILIGDIFVPGSSHSQNLEQCEYSGNNLKKNTINKVGSALCNNISQLLLDFSSNLDKDLDFTHEFTDDLDLTTSDIDRNTWNTSDTDRLLATKTRRKRSPFNNSNLDLTYKNCYSYHDSRIRTGLTKGDRFSCWYSNYCPCDLQKEEKTYVGARGGLLRFWSPCCLKDCSINVKIIVPPGKEIVLEFLELHVPSFRMLKSDGSHMCSGTKLFFPNDGYQFCGFSTLPPFRVYQNTVEFMIGLALNTHCKDYISFKLKYRMCEPVDMNLDVCQPQLVTLESGKSGYVTSPGFFDFTNYPNNLNCSWVIAVEEGSFVQLHFEVFRLPSFRGEYDRVTFHVDNVYDDTFNPIVLTYYGSDLEDIVDYKIVLPNNQVTVIFTSDDEDTSSGFKIIYQAVDINEYIPIINQVTLNCSDANGSLPYHIRCNLRKDCLDGEDEQVCDFINKEKCPEGHMFGNSCYHLVKPEKAITWESAEGICQKRYAGHLVTPNTNNELEFLEHLLPLDPRYYYIGVRKMEKNVDMIYSKLEKGNDGKTFFNSIGYFYSSEIAPCSSWSSQRSNVGKIVHKFPCSTFMYGAKLPGGRKGSARVANIICETKTQVPKIVPISATNESVWADKIETFQCIYSKERIQLTRLCDGVRNCDDGSDESNCDYGVVKTRSFQCTSGQSVSYSHVCDGLYDCLDKSDENFCQPMPDGLWNMTNCANGLSIPSLAWCDGKLDCLDHSDESNCETCNGESTLCPSVGCYPNQWVHDGALDCPIRDKDGFWVMEPDFEPHASAGYPPPGIVYPDGYGKVLIQPIAVSESCPNTHAQCPDGYCIPTYMLCNGYEDCPEGEDEHPETCSSFCENNYKCHKSTICLHDSHVCDGWFHCPYQDDEKFCNLTSTCPENCACSSLEMKCKDFNNNMDLAQVKFLDTSSTSLSNPRFTMESYQLIVLNMTRSGLQEIGSLLLPNLYTLDLAENKLSFLEPDQFNNCQNIRILLLARNEMIDFDFGFLRFLRRLEMLDLSFNVQKTLISFAFKPCTKLKHLRMTNMEIRVIAKNAFSSLNQLETLNLANNPLSSFQADIFVELNRLSYLISDNYKFCCSQVVPESLLKGTCDAPINEISSCEDILRTEFFRVFLWVMATLTILGNTGVFFYHIFGEKKASGLGYRTFVTSLSGSDLLMGVYLSVIGIADTFYRGKYLFKSDEWTHSGFCKLAGFLCMLSSEVSAVTICFVTLDRFLALAFPLSTLHFTPCSARVTALITWSLGIAIAGIPLLPPLDHWQFYSQNGVCIPLPITRNTFPGSDYSFSIFIIFNFFIFLLIALGQCLVFWAIKSNSMKDETTREKKRVQDIAIAQKLAFVVITDFLCWFPIGIMGLLSRLEIPISGQANVVATIFILPLNSALNPLIYTLSAIKQKKNAQNSKKKLMLKNRKGKMIEIMGHKSAKTERIFSKATAATSLSSRSDSITSSRAASTTATENVITCNPEQITKSVNTARAKTYIKRLKLWLNLGKISREEIQNSVDTFLTEHSQQVHGIRSVHETD